MAFYVNFHDAGLLITEITGGPEILHFIGHAVQRFHDRLIDEEDGRSKHNGSDDQRTDYQEKKKTPPRLHNIVHPDVAANDAYALAV